MRRLVDTDPAYAGGLSLDDRHRSHRAAVAPATPPEPGRAAAWTVHDARGGTDLPGTPRRAAGDPPTGDLAVDEASEGTAAALALFEEAYGRASYDGRGAPVSVTVHYGRGYANAFWDGTQLVFGDGDGRVFERFTKPVDVLGHELAHAVVEHTAGLVYEGQSGALNESVADAFAACLKQRLLGQTAAEGDWLVGAGLFRPGVAARGLRDMAAPGTAYDDPALGRDPQPAHLDAYVETTDDHGGVHVNSGIPNRAFHLAALAVGGTSEAGAGRIWYDALTGGDVGPRSDFASFAAATVLAAGPHADAVRDAWQEVGVVPGATGVPGARAAAPAPGLRVVVRRTGGFAGLVVEAAVDLDADRDDPRVPELRSLVGRVDLAGVGQVSAVPDAFVYDLDVCGERAVVPEPRLTPDLRRIVELVLGD
ncbi:M4 family metallopeptidase [Nocardioides deserti]|uniref:Neutral metalloproteinase n=1 Tax=Nocardioides deserti TaxID=1588644 RepID=A0ABR6UE03_9ACTN|nr:M4 family metallopeptidase [Nocardioides deserti]